MKISFLIVDWNGGTIFKQGIDSIYSNIAELNGLEYEIIVVDNASTDLDEKWLSNKPCLKLFKNPKNLFFAKATNQSVRYSSGDLLFLLNNDIILKENCLKILLAELNSAEADAVAPKLLNLDGSLQDSISGLPSPRDIFYASAGLYKISPKFDKWLMKKFRFDYDKKQLAIQPQFAALLIKRATWESVGEMDEKFPLFFNDVDWFHRFHLKHLRCLFVPDGEAFHAHGMSVNKNLLRKRYHSTVSMVRYLFKWHRFGWTDYLMLPYLVLIVPILLFIRDFYRKLST